MRLNTTTLLSPVVRPYEPPKLALLIEVLRSGATLLEDEETDELLLEADEEDVLDPDTEDVLPDDELPEEVIWITGLR